MPFVDFLECSRCQQTFDSQELYSLCSECHSPLLVRYDLELIKQKDLRGELCTRKPDMWRYFEVLPVNHQDDIVTLGEGYTPLLPLNCLGQSSEIKNLYVKDESLNPTGSFKARGLSVAVSMARCLGVQKLAIPTAGNAGGALAAYGAKAGLKVFVFMPDDAPKANVLEVRMAGAKCELVSGTIADAAKIVAERKESEGWFDVSTLKEPYRIEGKKTMGYELAEQFCWELPDVVVYPTGGGTGLIGMWKAFAEMEKLGWIGAMRPRMVAVQSEECAPIVRAFEQKKKSAEEWEAPSTFASGIRVPKAIGDFLILDALRESSGLALGVSEEEIYQSIREVGASEGIFLAPEGAACWAAIKKLRMQGWIGADEKVVFFNTGSGLKYVDSIQSFEKMM